MVDETKPFDEWNEQKQCIEKKRKTTHVKRREVWWSDLGINIGHEQDGGGPHFERPIVVLKVFGNDTCLIAPLTSVQGDTPFYFDLQQYGYRSRVIVTQLRIISTKRMSRSVERLDTRTFTALMETVKRMNGFL
jgi:mRNA-degrading endonuclease toxin of MazEF toxin-antitoxin module